jgi:hypothetical protein
MAVLFGSSASAPVIPDLELPTTNRLYYFYGGNGSSKPSGITGSDGAGISAWEDMDGLVTFSQATGSAQPTYYQAVEVATDIFRGCAQLGGDDFLLASVGVLSLQSEWTMGAVIRTEHASGGTIVAEGSTGSNTPFIRFDSNANKVNSAKRDNAGNTVSNLSTSDINNNAMHVLLMKQVGTTLSLYVDNLVTPQDSDSSVALGALTTNRFILGALYRATPIELWSGQVFSLFAYSGDASAALADSDIKSHYGIA